MHQRYFVPFLTVFSFLANSLEFLLKKYYSPSSAIDTKRDQTQQNENKSEMHINFVHDRTVFKPRTGIWVFL